MEQAQRKISSQLDKVTDLTEEDCFRILREQLSSRTILDYDEIPAKSLYKPHQGTIVKLISHTISTGESSSLLIVGPRGCGKTALLKSSINEIKSQATKKNNVLVVELNGLIHTADNIALKDLARQLKLNNFIEDSLRASFAENMALILDALKYGPSNNKLTLIFCIEEFDLFAHHKNQTLLYNLFDVAQSKNTPIVVLGVTCRLDVIELLEKRVKSRFSHRQLYLFNNLTFADYISTVCYLLTLRENFPDCAVKRNWNNFVVKVFMKNEKVLNKLKLNFNFSPNFSSLQKFLWPLIGEIQSSQKSLQTKNMEIPESFLKTETLQTDSKVILIQSLSLLELTLVIVMFQHSKIHEGEPFNFYIVYDQYKKLIQNESGVGLSGMQEFSKPVVSKSYENIEHLELIQPADTVSIMTSYKGQKDYRSMYLLVQEIQLKEALKIYPSLPTQLSQLSLTLFQ